MINNSPYDNEIIIKLSKNDQLSSNEEINNLGFILINNPQIDNLNLYDYIELKANLYPISNKFFPSSFDYRKYLYHRNIGATAIIKNYFIIKNNEKNIFEKINFQLQNHRSKIYEKISSKFEPQISAVLIAVLLGDKSFMNNDHYDYFKKSGAAHLLAVSGLHVALFSGIFFIFFRYFLLFISLRIKSINPKKLSAAITLLLICYYLFLSNFSWSAQRASIMFGFLYVAVLFDKKSLSINNIIRAGYIILLLMPFSIEEVGFQLSFIATASLIKVYEYLKQIKKDSLLFAFFPFSAFLSSLIISIVTFPIIMYNFSNISLFSPICNFFIIPIFSIIIMPLAFIYIFTSGFIEIEILNLLISFSINVTNKIVYFFTLNNFDIFVKPFPTYLLLIICLLIFLSLFSKIKHMIIIIPSLLFFTFNANIFNKKFDFIILNENKNIIWNDKGEYYKLNNKQKFYQNQFETKFNNSKQIKSSKINCDKFGCILPIKEWTISFIQNENNIQLDCMYSDIIILLDYNHYTDVNFNSKITIPKNITNDCDSKILHYNDKFLALNHPIFAKIKNDNIELYSINTSNRKWN